MELGDVSIVTGGAMRVTLCPTKAKFEVPFSNARGSYPPLEPSSTVDTRSSAQHTHGQGKRHYHHQHFTMEEGSAEQENKASAGGGGLCGFMVPPLQSDGTHCAPTGTGLSGCVHHQSGCG